MVLLVKVTIFFSPGFFFASAYRYNMSLDLHSACTGFAVKLKVFRQDESVIQECEKKIVIAEGEYHFFYFYYCTSCPCQ